jgi:hypothetical protein
MKETPVIFRKQQKKTTASQVRDGGSSFFKQVVQPKLTINQPNDIYEQEADAVADKVMRMTDTTQTNFFKPVVPYISRKCDHCEEEENKIQYREMNGEESTTGSTLENYAGNLISSGRPLPDEVRNFYEPLFGYDFSNVKVHTDTVATKSAQSINALAYTSGNNIVFNHGQYSPDTDSGKKLLGHELTHVVQQGGIQRKVQRACFDEERPNRNISACAEGSVDIGRQAQGQSNTRDSRANTIIAAAQSATVSLQDRAMQVVNDIICAYMPSQAAKVRKILYYAAETGLHTQSVGSGATAQGDICVGDYFVNNTTNAGISRRVLQVAHELEHIDQYRSGMTGGGRSDEREFLAFYDEALADEFIGTGRMADATRRGVIDAAIGYYYCLSTTLQTQYAGRLQSLLTKRQTVNGTAGNAATSPPTACRRQ